MSTSADRASVATPANSPRPSPSSPGRRNGAVSARTAIHRQVVRDHVVELAGDPVALLHDRTAFLLLDDPAALLGEPTAGRLALEPLRDGRGDGRS